MWRESIGRGLGLLERVLHAARARIEPFAGRTASANGGTVRPLASQGWEELYLAPVEPVRSLAHPVARALAELTSTGDLLLETGCGSAALSAELATAGRRIALADFSPRILERARRLFAASNLPEPVLAACDLRRPLPWRDGCIDCTWSSGVLEHWTDGELLPILCEMRRISRKCVVSLVPHAGCLLYRLAKDLAERRGVWPYGRELPRDTLAPLFQRAGLVNVREWTLWEENAAALLALTEPGLHKLAAEWWSSLSPSDPVKASQGYLLLTVGYIPHTS